MKDTKIETRVNYDKVINFTHTALLLHLELRSTHVDLQINHYSIPKYNVIENLMDLNKLTIYNITICTAHNYFK